MKKTFITVAISLLVLLAFAFTSFNEKPQKMLNIKKDDYTQLWKEVDSLERKGLPQSALIKVEEILELAKKENNPPQTIKAIIYQNKYYSTLEENGLEKAINRMKKETEAAEFPIQPILHSMLGEMYMGYLNNNTWKIQDRTTTIDFDPNDIATWDMERFVNVSIEHYKASIKNLQTQQLQTADFEAILSNYNSSNNTTYPTVYSLLMARAIDFFSNGRIYLTQPAYTFVLDNEAAFAPTAQFVKADFLTKDTTSSKYETLGLFQELLSYYKNNGYLENLVLTELQRLSFVQENAVLENKGELYQKGLESLLNQYKNLPVSTEVMYKLAIDYRTTASLYNPVLSDAHQWDFKTAFELCEKAIERFPESLGAKQCEALKQQLLAKNLNVIVEEVVLPNQPILAKISYSNLSKTFGKVVKLTYKEAMEYNSGGQDELIANLNLKTPVSSWATDLKNNGDYREHSTEIVIPELERGYYALMIADNEGFDINKKAVNCVFFTVSEISFINRINSKGKQLLILTHRKTGEPLEGVKATFYSREYNSRKRKYEEKEVGTGVSDKNGKIQTNVNKKFYSFNARFEYKGDELNLNNNFYNYGGEWSSSKDFRTVIFLDRGIYRPGQTVYFKGLMLEFDSNKKTPEILANKEVTAVMYDANYQKVGEQTLTSNEFGTFHGSFVTPSSGLLGTMQISINHKGRADSKSFRVEEYKRPKFEAIIDPPKGSYQLNETVTVTGNAKAYAGNSIDGAKVTYRVVREVRFPYWRWWLWGINPYNSQLTEITNGTTQTDENGTFTISFEALPDRSIPLSKKPIFSYTVYADVTDITGETHSSSSVVKVGTVSLIADIDVPTQINQLEKQLLKINTENINGVFEPAKGTLLIERLQTPKTVYASRPWTAPDFPILTQSDFHKAFPMLPFGQENEQYNWATDKKVFSQVFDTEKEKTIELEKIKNWEQGAYKVTLSSKDKNGEEVEVVKYFTLWNPSEKEVPTNEALWVVPSKTTAEPNEMIEIRLGTAQKKAYFLYEVELDGDMIESKWLTVKGRSTIQLPIKENYRGNIAYQVASVNDSRVYLEEQKINVPFTNKALNIEYTTFRDKLLPGQEEEWQIKISGYNKEKVMAEMVATLYDASLDAFVMHDWNYNFLSYNRRVLRLQTSQGFETTSGSTKSVGWNEYKSTPSRTYPALNWFNFSFYDYDRIHARMTMESSKLEEVVVMGSAPSAPVPAEYKAKMTAPATEEAATIEDSSTLDEVSVETPTDFGDVQVRTNLNETVFFLPELRTDEEGNIIIKFKMNEALTRWKFLGFAHTKDFKFGFTQNEIVTQKQLMVTPNPPRFLRENDEISFTAKVSNLSEKDLKGKAKLLLFDALTMQPIDKKLGNIASEIDFEAKQGQSDAVNWQLKIPDAGLSAVTYRVVAKADNYSDGEENTLPVLTNRMLLVETQPLPIRGEQTQEFTFTALQKASESTTLKHHEMTLEFTSNPAWYAVQSLPYLMEYPYECTEQVFNRYYANTLAASVANSTPRIKQVFESWKNITPKALESNLSKNQELKYALLEETPWVFTAQSEEEQKKNIGLLFDLNRMGDELNRAMKKMQERQLDNGGFAWFPGGRDSWYITQYLVEGMGHLKRLGALEKSSGLQNSDKAEAMIIAAVQYIDDRLIEYYTHLQTLEKEGKIDLKEDHLSYVSIHYLYTRSFYLDIDRSKAAQDAMDYFVGQAKKYWLGKGYYAEGMLSLALFRLDDDKTSKAIVKSLKERSLNNPEMGMYWKYNTGYWWYELPIETHSIMIEVFDEVANDAKAVEDLKTWLLKNRQTTHWKTTKATASAVYAMLLRGENWLEEGQPVEIYFGGNKFDQSKVKKEAGTGYFKTKLGAENITKDMASIKIVNPNKNPAWGALYWQYFEDYDKVKSFEATPLTLKKQLFKSVNTDKGPVIQPIDQAEKIETGDKIIVRIELRVDRDMEYVHMKDSRASGFEPINVLSSYKWQGGLGYYESTRDASTHFFFDYLPKGTYVFEYPLRANLKGNFSNGVTTIQCMYAPEFTSHSEGIRVTIE